MQGRADRQAFVARSRLYPSVAKWRAGEQLPIGNAVQRTSAGHRQIFHRHAFMKAIQEVKENFLKTMLHRIRKVHVPLSYLRSRIAGRTEQLDHAPRKMAR